WANLSALKRASRALHLRLQHDTRSSITVGLGRYHRGIPGLQRSYDDARAALAVGRRFSGPGRVYCLDDLGMPALVSIADERTPNGRGSDSVGVGRRADAIGRLAPQIGCASPMRRRTGPRASPRNEASMPGLRVLTWHVHGNYLYYLAQSGHKFVVPFLPGR